MKIARIGFKGGWVLFATIAFLCASPVSGDRIFAPQYLWDRGIAQKTDPTAIADAHVGIPYRDDGALDDQGYFTTFADSKSVMDTPGLNCSGLVVSISRYLFNKNWRLDEVSRDRQNNSGPGAALGRDWDFGYDLILNLTENRPRRALMPDGKEYDLSTADGSGLRGFDLQDANAWEKVIARMTPGKVYLGSISKSGENRGYKLMHYHVVLILPDKQGGVQLYHATRRSRTHKLNIASRDGLNKFLGEFRGGKNDGKRILLVEASLPGYENTTQAADSSHQPGPTPVANETRSAPRSAAMAQSAQEEAPIATDASPASRPAPETGPEQVVNHLSGRVYKAIPNLSTQIPKLDQAGGSAIHLGYINRGNTPHALKIRVKGPDGTAEFSGLLEPARELIAAYPQDFQVNAKAAKQGRYVAEVSVDGAQWLADVFELALPREAQPRIINVRIPPTIQAGRPFEVRVEAQNQGAESDWGGITVSSPEPSAMKITGVKQGRLYGSGSTVLAVTTDRIRTKVPMAERWIELWGENQAYDMTVQFQAAKPGVYPIYVRCALRGVHVKSNVTLMDPKTAPAVDQQGFPVYVYQVTVR